MRQSADSSTIPVRRDVAQPEDNGLPGANDQLLVAEALNVQRSGRPILKNLSFTITPGTLTGLIGPNGSGKTTLLRALSGYWPYEGSIRLSDQEIKDWDSRALARRLAVVRQAPTLSFDFSVKEIVLLGLLPHKSTLQGYSSKDRQQMDNILSKVELSGFADRHMHGLSGGEQQRVYLAQALLQDTDILLLDEPTAHLDVHNQYGFLCAARELTQMGRTIIVVFHDLELAARFADDLLVLDQGQLVTAGKPSEILSESLIKDVFKMKASLYTNSLGQIGITYFSATRHD